MHTTKKQSADEAFIMFVKSEKSHWTLKTFPMSRCIVNNAFYFVLFVFIPTFVFQLFTTVNLLQNMNTNKQRRTTFY